MLVGVNGHAKIPKNWPSEIPHLTGEFHPLACSGPIGHATEHANTGTTHGYHRPAQAGT
jgi:hypothetical protein